MKTILLVFLGGGAGSVLRYLLSLLFAQVSTNYSFPVGTFLCNIFGCFLIGLFNSMTMRMGWGTDVRLMLTVGLCGGFTTFSTFSNEGIAMLQSGNYAMYAIYVVLSIIMGAAAVMAGMNV